MRKMKRIAVVSTLAFVGIFAIPSGAWAAGELTPAGCVDDNDSGPDTCAQSVNALDNATAVAVSPDGKSVYATGFNDQAIVRFNRSSTGVLTPAGCIDDNDFAGDVCAQSVNGLGGATGVAVSPDGTSVYVASQGDSAIVRFNRDPSGALTPAGCIDDNDLIADKCALSVNGMSGARGITVSPDGKSVYVASFIDDAVVRFNRSATGALTSGGCVDDDAGPDTCAQSGDGLDGVISVAVSPDGTSVYGAAKDDDAVQRFNRSSSGALTPIGCVGDNDTGTVGCALLVSGLDNSFSVTVSPDGKSVYVVSADDQALVRFNRNSVGALSSGGCIDDLTGLDSCASSTNGLDGAFSVAVSPDGLSVYVVSLDDDAIVQFDRASSGAITAVGCIDDNDTGLDICARSANALDNLFSVAVSPDGRSVYTASAGDDAIARFNRAV